MISEPSLQRVFGPLTLVKITPDTYNGAPQDAKPCSTGQISEITECNHCQFNCKVGSNDHKHHI